MSSNVVHWLLKRITAVLLIPLAFYSCVKVMRAFLFYDSRNYVFDFSIPLTVFMILSLYHGVMGIRTIIEDYVQSVGLRLFSISIVYLLALITAVVLVLFSISFSFLNLE